MSSTKEGMAALEASIAKYEGLFDAATTAPENKRLLLAAITALRTQQTELMKLSGNCTDCDFHNPTVFHFWN